MRDASGSCDVDSSGDFPAWRWYRCSVKSYLDCSILLRLAVNSTVAYYASTTSAFANHFFSSAKKRWSWGLWGLPLAALLLLREPVHFDENVR